jgi:urease accessory protein
MGTDPVMQVNDPSLHRLLAWLSPSYPTGAFSYSHGLEWAVEAQSVRGLQDLLEYVETAVTRGGGWIDAVLFVHIWRNVSGNRAWAKLDELVELSGAFRASAETALESRQQGSAFLQVTRRAWPHPFLDCFAEAWGERPLSHCAAVALTCAAHNVALEPALQAYLHAFAANLVSAGARLIPLGQTDAQIAIARLAPVIDRVCLQAMAGEIEDLGTAAPILELGSLQHETQYTRLFRS